MSDLEALKSSVNLYDLASHDTQLKKIGDTRGGEWAGPCPKCGVMIVFTSKLPCLCVGSVMLSGAIL